MKVKELEQLLLSHLQESSGIQEKIKNLNSKMNWILGLIAAIFVAFVTKAMKG